MNFSVLDPSQPVDRSYFLEASAGTGKTFTIEHLVTRLLMETEATIDRILVVTFTKAATQELRTRIRSAIEAKADGKLALEQALMRFEEAQIYTIHGFCYQMLIDHAFDGGIALGNTEPATEQTRRNVVRDWFRLRQLSPGQLEVVIGGRAETQVLDDILRTSCDPAPRFEESLALFGHAMQRLDLEPRDIEALLSSFTGLADRSGNVKPEVRGNLDFFAGLLGQASWSAEDFDRLIVEGCIPLDKMARGKLKARATADISVLAQLDSLIGPALDPARDRKRLMGRISADCESLFDQRQELTFDRMLRLMAESLDLEPFLQAVQNRFDAAIVDEFQDTDQLQWQIFSRLFLGQGKPFVVVGDPKQSIYAFRSADVYSYLGALDAMGRDCLRTLGTNYRSRPNLIKALNRLFDRPGWMPLPKIHSSLEYKPVEAGIAEDSDLSKEDPVVFVRGEDERTFYPYIANEIQQLGLPWSSYVILVSDRYQGDRLQRYLSRFNIPAVTTRGVELSESEAPHALREVVQALFEPRQIRLALAGPIFGWSFAEIEALSDEERHVDVMARFALLRDRLQREGFPAFFAEMLGDGVATRLLGRTGGETFLSELTQIAGRLSDQPIKELDRLVEEGLSLRPANDGEAVEIMTTFASKGLEFDVVFALGLSSRTPKPFDIAERDAEKARLFYVALTRAKERVYIPIIEKEPPQLGTASPVELFLEHGQPEKIVNLIDPPTPKVLTPPQVALCEPLSRQYTHKRKVVQSFTSLARPVHTTLGAPSDPEAEVRTPFTLPAGAQTGILIHHLFEAISFQWVGGCSSPADLTDFVQGAIRGSRLVGWEEVIAEILFNTLRTPLTDGFRLCDLSKERMRREAEFLFPVSDGFTQGFVDLFFEHDGRYYIVDWKTNWLGDQAEDYRLERLQGAMRDADYFLQAEIYREAMERYLQLAGLTHSFGGAYYLFVRGMDGSQGNGVMRWS